MIISINEYERIKIGKKIDIDKKIITANIAKGLSDLENKKNKSLFDWGRDFVGMKQWIGVISFESVSIEVMPKIGNELNKDKIMKSIIIMLNKVYDVKIQKDIYSNLGQFKNGFIEVLIHLFIKELEYQVGKGLYKEYEKESKNIKVLKGKLNIQKNIQKNIVNIDRFYCCYSKFTKSNTINKVIRFTLELLYKISGNKKNRLLLKKITMNFNDVNIDIDVYREIDKIIYSRDNIRFEKIINLCKLFLESIGTTLNAGGYSGISFLVDMNDLFEKYIYRVFKEDKSLSIKYQNKEHYLLNDKLNHKKFLLKPDIILEKKERKMIIDTKWKIVKSGIDIKDIYQMNAYMDIINDAEQVILLFPQCKNNDKIVNDYSFCNKINKKLKIRTIDILKVGSIEFTKELLEIIN